VLLILELLNNWSRCRNINVHLIADRNKITLIVDTFRHFDFHRIRILSVIGQNENVKLQHRSFTVPIINSPKFGAVRFSEITYSHKITKMLIKPCFIN
jgi:hypothetical protein